MPPMTMVFAGPARRRFSPFSQQGWRRSGYRTGSERPAGCRCRGQGCGHGNGLRFSGTSQTQAGCSSTLCWRG